MSNDGSFNRLFVEELSVTGVSSFLGLTLIEDAYIPGNIYTQGFEVQSGFNYDTYTYQQGTRFFGEVDFSEATVSGLPAGPMGATGAQGFMGATGAQGFMGAPGNPGAQGPMGPMGAIGPMGPIGPRGETGAPGAPGGSISEGQIRSIAGVEARKVSLTSATVTNIARNEANRAINAEPCRTRAAATTLSNGTMTYSAGISSMVADPAQNGRFTYYLDTPLPGGYAVSAQVMNNSGNYHANVSEQTDDSFTVLITRNGLGKASDRKHSVIVVK